MKKLNMQKNIRIISRNSDLAMWQANFVKKELELLYPDKQIEITGITTVGDKLLDRSLDKIGGKGLFIKELEYALINDKADIAVHSLKDLPAIMSPEFVIGAVLKRESSEDAFVTNKNKKLNELPAGSIIGTSSIRRVSILNKLYPHLKVKMLRGNVITRLKKLDNGEYDGIILAVAGLKRLGLTNRINEYLDIEKFIPAIGQGALAIEICKNNKEMFELVKPLTDSDTEVAVSCERELGRKLGANCSVPIAAHATILEDSLKLHAIILDKDTGHFCSSTIISSKHNYLSVADECAKELILQGAESILQKY